MHELLEREVPLTLITAMLQNWGCGLLLVVTLLALHAPDPPHVPRPVDLANQTTSPPASLSVFGYDREDMWCFVSKGLVGRGTGRS